MAVKPAVPAAVLQDSRPKSVASSGWGRSFFTMGSVC